MAEESSLASKPQRLALKLDRFGGPVSQMLQYANNASRKDNLIWFLKHRIDAQPQGSPMRVILASLKQTLEEEMIDDLIAVKDIYETELSLRSSGGKNEPRTAGGTPNRIITDPDGSTFQQLDIEEDALARARDTGDSHRLS